MYSSSTALLSTKLLRFFLAAPEKAVVRSSEAEDSGGPLLGRLMIADDKCAANLGLTNGFRMAVRYSPSGPSDYRARLCILGNRQLGHPPG
ncbi:adenosine 5'-monophosphoramidase HINT1-like [Cyrtonyx montezumae]|uniref:adenosine 5'-monophosphoramidase HINT1-like n=1 Tax=Cyrtonyx montezumae TaxID=9017 RepID=UPI0032DBB1C8